MKKKFVSLSLIAIVMLLGMFVVSALSATVNEYLILYL